MRCFFSFPLFRSFTESMNSLNPKKKWTTKLSSAGLVYLHFGEKIIAQLIGVCYIFRDMFLQFSNSFNMHFSYCEGKTD